MTGAMFRHLFALCLALAIGAGCAPAEDKGPVVLAAASLQPPLEELSAQWQASGRPAPVLNFASSAALARQIESGSPADIYVTADRQWLDYLAGQTRLTPASGQTIASNRLVLARHRDGANWTRESVLAQLGTEPLATGDPATVALGRFAQEAMESEGLWEKAAPRIVGAQNARAAMVLVRRGEAPLGVLYASDTHGEAEIEIVLTFPAASHAPIDYVAVVLPASAHPDTQGFLEFLASPEAAPVFARHGFAKR